MFFSEDHLRITKVRTLDGLSPVSGPDEKPLKKIIFAPLNKESKKLFEDQNTRLPTSLKMKIEVVPAYKPEPLPAQPLVNVSALEKEIAELKEQNRLLQEQNEKKMKPAKASNGTQGTLVDETKNVQHETK